MKKMYSIDTEDFPTIPSEIISSWGQRIKTYDDVWYMNDVASSANIFFREVKNDQLRYFFKLYYSFKIQTQSLAACRNSSKFIVNLFSSDIEKLTKERIISIILEEFKIRSGTENEYKLWFIKDWYIWSSDMSLPFFCEDFCLSLYNIKISGNSKGQAVLSLSENEGPLKEIELNQFIEHLKQETSPENLQSRLLCWLFLTLGCNPRNLSLIKVNDFKKVGDKQVGFVYFLNVPRIKKRSDQGFKNREIDQRIGKLLENYITTLALSPDDYLFTSKLGTPYQASNLSIKVADYVLKLNTANFKVHINPRRLRYTFATRLVMAGVSKERLADLLDHSDLQNIQVYYDLRHQIKGYLSEAESKKLSDVFNRFEGKLSSEKDKINGEDLKFYSPQSKPVIIGKCGQGSLCDLSPPYSCFVCPKFNAFEESLEQYKAMLSKLLGWRSKRIEKYDTNDRIHSLMDEVVVALQDLISQIIKRKLVDEK